MAETSAPPPSGLDATAEEAGFYHEASLNGTWTGSRLALGGLSFLFGAFLFAYFYLRSLNAGGRWQGSGFHHPSMVMGTVIMLLVLTSAGVHYAGLQSIKAGNKLLWQIGGLVALALGVAAVVLQLLELLFLPFWPGSSGYSSVFVGFYPVFLVILLASMLWLESLLMRSRPIPAVSFLEQPPTYTEAFSVQRFQANLSAFNLTWTYMAAMALLFWVLFYVIP
jgi:heme/copper-type cytochrome/quinol oxidase subunit 3